jgi:hypothetical protein
MNEQLKARLRGIQDVLMAHQRATALLPGAAKGDEREVLVREFLEKVFPAPYRFGSGAVTDSSGLISGQLDVIVEWPFFASFPAPLGTHRLYLADSVAFAMEVKSDLSSQWGQLERTVQQIAPLRRHWRTHLALNLAGTDLEHVGATSSRIPFIAVGFTGFKTVDMLRERIANTPMEQRPVAALVIESGAYVRTWEAPSATAEEGLFAFCVDCSLFARNVLFAEPDLERYVTAVKST